jgi:hypothetical protein
VIGGLLWGLSLWFATPLQLLLLFLGELDTSRPSDGVLRLLGTAAGQDVDAIVRNVHGCNKTHTFIHAHTHMHVHTRAHKYAHTHAHAITRRITSAPLLLR